MTEEAFAKLGGGPHVEWRMCVGLPDYMVSEYGDVMRVTKGATREAGHQPKGQLIGGYRKYKLMTPDGTKGQFWAHRLVLEAFVGLAPSPQHVCAHFDGNRLNNHPSNLRWATTAENAADTVRHGNSARGEKNNKARLTEDGVREIRRLHGGGVSGLRIARMKGLASTTVYQVLNGTTWGWVQ